MSITFFNEVVPLPQINFTLIKKIAKREVIRSEKKVGDINFIFCSDDHLLQINIQFLQHDYYTDVITFDYSEGNLISGDIFISVDRVLNNSEIYLENYASELIRVIFHGLFHLLGFDDKTPDEIVLMRKKESELIHSYMKVVS
jgi:probable rRNA maturation factor